MSFVISGTSLNRGSLNRGSTVHRMLIHHSVAMGAWDESHESEASQSFMFCFDNASPEKYCFVVDFVRFVSPSLQGFAFLNATSRE